ncbi:hypothetical protein [Lacticaseibacillus saniviri]|uniref:hypothetical protein n=1 Tax=Lacticaseibacillus saniviri TaxID=931533 RepID=UPI0006D260CA|nr:hypothetical protein [Lacticaseibacillus saniviri]
MKRKVILLGLLLALLGTAGCGQANQRAGSASESARDSINDGHLAIDGHTFRATEKNHMQAIVTVSSKPGATVTLGTQKHHQSLSPVNEGLNSIKMVMPILKSKQSAPKSQLKSRSLTALISKRLQSWLSLQRPEKHAQLIYLKR